MVMSMTVTLGAAPGPGFSIPDRSGHLFRHAERHPAVVRASSGAGRRWAAPRPVGEAGAEGAQRGAADREADLGDAEVATAQQRHRALDAPRHEVAVRRLAVREPELRLRCPADMLTPRASASTSSGCAYSRSIRSRARRSRARSRRCCSSAGLLVTCEIVPRRRRAGQRQGDIVPLAERILRVTFRG